MVDADEYFYLNKYKSINEFVATIPPEIEQVHFQWAMIENYRSMEGVHDLFDLLKTQLLYSNGHIKSMCKSELLLKYAKNLGGSAITHIVAAIRKSWLWGQIVDTKIIHTVEPSMYTDMPHPYILHFHTRSLQNIFIKCITTSLTKKQCDIDILRQYIDTHNISSIKKVVKFQLPFLHATLPKIMTPPLLRGIPVDFDGDIELLKQLCVKHSIDYDKLNLVIQELEALDGASFSSQS